MEETTLEWRQYQAGLLYQSKINLLATVDKNERFYSNRHWEGVKSNGLPTPILPLTKRIVDFKISLVMSDMIAMQYSAEGIADDTNDPRGKMYREVAALLTEYSRTMWENLKLDAMNEEGLLDAAISGDMISYWYWDDTIDVGNNVKGDIRGELIDNVNFFPGNTNLAEINDIYGPLQPYIIISFRKQVQDVRMEAMKNGVAKDKLQEIVADSDTENRAGDRAKTELDAEKDEGKCTVLLKLWKEMGDDEQWHIKARKSIRNVIIRDTWDTGLHRYPVALMNWYKRKGSTHGEAEVTSLIPNNIMINQMAAMIALWIKLHGFPKVIYDKTRVPVWDNNISTAVAINGDITGAAQYMQPAQLSAAVQTFFEQFITLTKELAGANEAILGESKPINTSAIIVLQKATAVPLNSIKRRFYRYIEDIGLIWLDFWLSKYAEYPERMLQIKKDNFTTVIPFDAKQVQGVKFKLKIDVGPSTQWNEAAAVQTLDNLLQRDLITFVEYLKRIPNGLIPDKQGLIAVRENGDDKLLLYELMARFVETLPPEQRQMLMSLPPEQLEDAVKKLILGGGGDAQTSNEFHQQRSVQEMAGVRPYAENIRTDTWAYTNQNQG